MALGKRWSLTFRSLSNVTCNVYIYDDGWTGGVTSLIGAANPFYWEEDNDESLLTVLRYRTGYLRVIETEYKALIDLYPTTSTSRYIEFYYGDRLDFTGYLQVQNFQEDWTASPRVLEFPIISPLGLCQSKKFDAGASGADISLLMLVKELVEDLNATANTDTWYQKIIVPDVDGAPGLEGIINALVYSPYNSEFTHATEDSPVYDPVYFSYILEGICNAYGWILHDTPDALIFSRFDWDGAYAYYVVDFPIWDMDKYPLDDYAGNIMRDLTDSFQVRDAEATESLIQPFKSITLNYEGDDLKSVDADFAHTRTVSESKFLHHGFSHQDANDEYPYAIWLKPADHTFTGGKLLDENNFVALSDGALTDKGVNIAFAGSETSAQDRILINWDTNWTAGTQLFTASWLNHPSGFVMLSMNLSWGGNLLQLEHNSIFSATPKIAFSIKCNNKYFAGNSGWVSTEQIAEGNIPDNGEVRFLITDVPVHGRLTLTFYVPSSFSYLLSSMILSFDTLNLESYPVPFAVEYLRDDTAKTVIAGTQGEEEGSVDMSLSCYRLNSNIIGDTVLSLFTDYQYLLNPQNRVEARFLPLQFDTCQIYLEKWRFWIKQWRWRIVALAAEPWNDLYTLTLHRSPVLESRAYLADNTDTIFESMDDYLFRVLDDAAPTPPAPEERTIIGDVDENILCDSAGTILCSADDSSD